MNRIGTGLAQTVNKYHLLKEDALQALNHKCEERIISPLSLFISICCSANSIKACINIAMYN